MFDRNVGSSKLVVELARGIEPPTCGLQNRCSAVELRQRPRASAMYGSILHYGEHYLSCVIARSTATPRRHCEADTVSRSNLVCSVQAPQSLRTGERLLRFARDDRVRGEYGTECVVCV